MTATPMQMGSIMLLWLIMNEIQITLFSRWYGIVCCKGLLNVQGRTLNIWLCNCPTIHFQKYRQQSSYTSYISLNRPRGLFFNDLRSTRSRRAILRLCKFGGYENLHGGIYVKNGIQYFNLFKKVRRNSAFLLVFHYFYERNN